MSGRILLVDDMATNRILYRARLAAAFYEPLLAGDGEGCLRQAVDGRPDLILLDLNLPDMTGHEVLRRLRTDPRTRDIPVIVLTAAQDSETRLRAFSAGADDVIVKPAGDQVLLARVRNLLRGRRDAEFPASADLDCVGLAEAAALFEPRATVALVSGRADLAQRLQKDLAGQLRDRLVVLTRAEILADAAPTGPDVPDVFIIQDEDDPQGALRLLSELKSRAATRHSAVCVVSAAGDDDDAAMVFDLGADDVVAPQVSAAELALRTRSLLRRKRQGDQRRARIEDGLRLAMVDPLTGLHNRRYAMSQLAAIAARATEIGQDFAVMVLDLDRFKTVNDRHGHAAGDAVLVEVARRLRANLRDGDLLARIGGEEFLVVVPDSSTTAARQVAERVCGAFDQRPISLASGVSLKVTVSIGVAVSAFATGAAVSVNRLVEEADLALLQSKGAGRNQVTYRLSAA